MLLRNEQGICVESNPPALGLDSNQQKPVHTTYAPEKRSMQPRAGGWRLAAGGWRLSAVGC